MVALCIVLLFSCGAISLAEETPASPEYLDSLLANKNYEEFARIMGIENVDLVKPGPDSSEVNPMFNKGLKFGDIMMPRQASEEARQGIRFDKWPGSKWPGRPGIFIIPYVVSTQFSADNARRVEIAVDYWNQNAKCVKWVARTNQNDYVSLFPGNGCWSYVGRIGGGQALSLQQNGCMGWGTILHEMDHAAGTGHEQGRTDRDDYIEILWNNIPDEWKSQYEKQNPDHMGLQASYDYYSVMHYGVIAPGTNKKAFNVKQNGVNENEIGNRNGFTWTDVRKLDIQYC